MRRNAAILAVLISVFIGCGGPTADPVPPLANTAEPGPSATEQPQMEEPRAGWDHHEAKSEDGKVVVRYSTPKGMIWFDVGWTDPDSRMEAVMEYTGNHVRIWELERPVDAKFDEAVVQEQADFGSKKLSDTTDEHGRVVSFETETGESAAMIRHGAFICRGEGTDDEDAMRVLVLICGSTSVTRSP